MRVISEERLIYWFDLLADKGRLLELEMVRTLIDECKEIDPWIPIDENTPKDKPLLLLYQADDIFRKRYDVAKYNPGNEGRKPTHYQELLDPKE